MKLIFLIFIFTFFLPSQAAVDPVFEIVKEIRETFKNDPYLTKSIVTNLRDMRILNKKFGSNVDIADYVQARKVFAESRACVVFLVTGDDILRNKFKTIMSAIHETPEFKDFQLNEFRKFKDPAAKAQLPKINLEDGYKYCENISKKEVERIQSRIKLDREQKDANYKKMTFDNFHPEFATYLLRAQKTISESQPNLPAKHIDEQIVGSIDGYFFPVLEKIIIKHLKTIETRCPGKTEEIWKECNGKKYYDTPYTLKFPDLFKFFCHMQFKTKISPSCIDEKNLIINRKD